MKRISAIALAVLFLIGLCSCSVTVNSGAENYNVGDGEVTDEVNGIIVNWSAGSVTVQYGDVPNITVTETGKKADDGAPVLRWYVIGDVLRVQYETSGFLRFFSWKNGSENLTITLPRERVLSHMDFYLSSASLQTEPVSADSLMVYTSSGSVDLAIGQVRHATIETASGSVNVSGKVTELDVETSSGRVTTQMEEAEYLNLETSSGAVKAHLPANLKESDIETSSGSVEIFVPASLGFTLEFETSSGKMENGLGLMWKNNRYTFGDGSAEMSIETSSGDVRLYPES